MGLLFFLLGACFGSFLGVVIYRLPRKLLPIGLSRSVCPQCGQGIRWYDNVPILSYILLGGRCRFCRSRISIKYLLIELITAFLFLLTYYQFGINIKTLSLLVLFSILIAVSFIDLNTRKIPDVLTLPGMIAGLAISFWTISVLKSAVGIAVGVGVLWIVAIIGKLLLKQEAMGGGDIKLLGMVGAFLGPLGALLTLFFGALVGVVVSVPMRKKRVPFGPFLSTGAFIAALWGERIINLIIKH
ncbi:MAG: prepilin peptidase [candidate division WOR-3 bacterium]|nr:prepilin peptidase [candidate division WOR-3 bacterium]